MASAGSVLINPSPVLAISAKVSQVSAGVRVWGLRNPEIQSIVSISRGRLSLQEQTCSLAQGSLSGGIWEIGIWALMWGKIMCVQTGPHILHQMQIYLLTPYNSIVVLRRFRFIKMFIERCKHNSRTIFKQITCCEILIASWVGMGCLEKDGTLSLLASDLENLSPRSHCLS